MPLEESRGHSCPTLRLLLADQRSEQQELFGARASDFAKRRLGDQQVSSLKCSSEDRSRVPLGGDLVAPLLGPEQCELTRLIVDASRVAQS
jgi:hypothetical protein